MMVSIALGFCFNPVSGSREAMIGFFEFKFFTPLKLDYKLFMIYILKGEEGG